MPGGMTNEGYLATTVDDEVNDLNDKFLANISATLDLAPDQPFGQVIGIFAEKFTSLTELGATVFNAMNPDAAEGRLLTNVCAITGTLPQVATYSTVTLDCVLNAGSTVTSGSTAIVNGQPTNIWVLTANITNSSGVQATVPGTFRAQNPGAVTANANTITVIGTPTVGWVSVNNPADATVGLAADTDTTLRQKRAVELLGQGSGDLDAIRAAVLKVGGVVSCFVYENNTMQGDITTGRPPKSFEVVIWDGAGMDAANNNIAQAIWDNKPAGIMPYGANSVGTAIDKAGIARTVPFNRAQQIPIYINVTVNATLTTAQAAGIKAAIVAFAQENWGLGVSVIYNRLFGLVYSSLDTGGYSADEVTALTVGTTPSPVGTSDIAVSGLQIATLSSTNILVNGV